MAGNTVYVQGSYVDVHDNEVVNLSIDKATVNVQKATDNDIREKAAVLTSNEEFGLIMRKAVEQGFCIQAGWQYKWKVKVEAAYFASVASHRFNLSDRKDHEGDVAISWIPFEALFGEKNLRLAYNDYKQCKTTIRRKSAIDNLFR